MTSTRANPHSTIPRSFGYPLAGRIAVNSQLEQIRKDEERLAERRLWDLKERLDYANTSKRRWATPLFLLGLSRLVFLRCPLLANLNVLC